MIFYVSILSSMTLLRYALMGYSKVRMQLYPVLLGLLFIVSAFRFEVGCDWSGYLNQWNVQEVSTFWQAFLHLEPTWWAMMQGMQSLGLSYLWLNVVSSAIFFAGINVLARRQPDPLGFLVLLFPILIINMPMSGIRQATAIGIMCIAFVNFSDKKVLRFAAWTLLASTFHNSAIVFLLLVPLVGGNYSKKRLLMAAVLALPGALVLLTGAGAGRAISRYVGTDYEAAGAVFRLGFLLLSGLVYFLFLGRKWRSAFPGDYKLASVGALMMCAMIVLLPVSTIIGDRLGYYMIPLQTMIFARISYLHLRNSRAFFSAAPYLGLGVLFLVWTSLSWHFEQCYTPYQTWVFGPPAVAKYAY